MRRGPCDRELGAWEQRMPWWWRQRGERWFIDDVGWKWRRDMEEEGYID
jgi:hypothetical protein